jgi:hypothetical protein
MFTKQMIDVLHEINSKPFGKTTADSVFLLLELAAELPEADRKALYAEYRTCMNILMHQDALQVKYQS